MKEVYYFQHDYNAANDPKIICLLGNHGGLGYGIYWLITEMLHQEEEHKLPKELYIHEAIAKQMLTDAQQIEAIINDCINKFKLLSEDDEFFWSKRVLNNIKKREEEKQKKVEAGRIGGIKSGISRNKKKQNEAPLEANEANEPKQNKTKQNKTKQSKLNNIYKFIIPSIKEIATYCIERKNNVDPETFHAFYESNGWMVGKNKMKSWQAAIITWEKNNKNKILKIS